MSIRSKFALMVAIPILAILGVFLVGIINFNGIQHSLSEIVLLEGDRVMISEADRDAYQALVAESNVLSSVTLNDAQKNKADFDENADQAYSRISGSTERYTPEMMKVLSNFELNYNNWVDLTNEVLKRALNVVDGNRMRIEAGRTAIASFNTVRGYIDEIGASIDQQLGGDLSLQRRRDLESALSLILNGDRDFYQAYVATLLIERSVTKEDLEQQISDYHENLGQTIDRVAQAARISGSTVKNLADSFSSEIAVWEKSSDQLILISERTFDDNLYIRANSAAVLADFEGMREHIDELGQLDQALVDGLVADIFKGIKTTVLLYIIILVLAVVLSVVTVVIIAFGINRNIIKGLNLSQELAQGDLTTFQKVEKLSKDEIGRLVSSQVEMASRLREVVASIMAASENVASGSRQISASSESVSQGAEEQAAGTEEVSSSIEEMGSSIEQTAENASATEDLSRQVVEGAISSKNAVDETVEMMNQIAEKTTLIENIAKQTNLLALNAAIEAARAGESGKGFAVVASEVRKLAENSGMAAGEISELSGKSVAVSRAAGENLNRLVPNIQKSADLIQEISAAMRELRSGTNQINDSINQLDTVVQGNASASEELASTAEELSGQAEGLRQQIMFFRMDESDTRRRSNRDEDTLYLPEAEGFEEE